MSFGERKLPSWMLDEKVEEAVQPTLVFRGLVNYCPTLGDMGMACEGLLNRVECVDELAVGFDMEWPVDFVKGSGRTALIQLCSDERMCHLLHVNEIPRLPTALLHLIRHPHVKLVGVNIKNDVWKLGRDFDLSVRDIINRTIDLGQLANTVLICRQSWSLARLVQHLLKQKIDKSQEVRLSNWSMKTLSARQQVYAATDAFVSILIYKRLREMESSR